MVCTKCNKQGLGLNSLVTPTVKKRNDKYLNSPSSPTSPTNTSRPISLSKSRSTSYSSSSFSSTLGQNGVSKSKLLSKAAKNPLAQYSSRCTKCHKGVAQGHTYCHSCAFRRNKCAGCGRKNKIQGTGNLVDDHTYSLH